MDPCSSKSRSSDAAMLRARREFFHRQQQFRLTQPFQSEAEWRCVIPHISLDDDKMFDLRAPVFWHRTRMHVVSLLSSRSTRDVQIALAPRDELLSHLLLLATRDPSRHCARDEMCMIGSICPLAIGTPSLWTKWDLLGVVLLRKDAVK